MAITVQNVQTTAWTSTPGNSITITKPTGLTVGNLMVAVIAGYSGANPDPITPSGWTKLHGSDGASPEYAVFYKTADAGDVAASNFTFTASDADYMAGVLYRIDGFLAPITISYDADEDTDGVTTGAFTFIKALTPAIADALIISAFIESNNDGNACTFGTYTLTGSPTFTERLDTQQSTTANSAFAVADANYASTTQIVSAGASVSANTDRIYNVVVMIYGAQNASGTTALLQATPTFFAPTSGGGTTGTADLLEVTPTFFVPTSEVEEKTISNLDKNNATNIVNLDKNDA